MREMIKGQTLYFKKRKFFFAYTLCKKAYIYNKQFNLQQGEFKKKYSTKRTQNLGDLKNQKIHLLLLLLFDKLRRKNAADRTTIKTESKYRATIFHYYHLKLCI